MQGSDAFRTSNCYRTYTNWYKDRRNFFNTLQYVSPLDVAHDNAIWVNTDVEKLNLWTCTTYQFDISCCSWKNLNWKITNFEKASFIRNVRAGEHFDNVSASMVHRIDDDFSLICCGNTLIWRFRGCNLVTMYDRRGASTSGSTTFLLLTHIGSSYKNKR